MIKVNDLVYLVNVRGEYLRIRPGFHLFEKPSEVGLGNAYYSFERDVAEALLVTDFRDCHLEDVHIEDIHVDLSQSFLRPTA